MEKCRKIEKSIQNRNKNNSSRRDSSFIDLSTSSHPKKVTSHAASALKNDFILTSKHKHLWSEKSREMEHQLSAFLRPRAEVEDFSFFEFEKFDCFNLDEKRPKKIENISKIDENFNKLSEDINLGFVDTFYVCESDDCDKDFNHKLNQKFDHILNSDENSSTNENFSASKLNSPRFALNRLYSRFDHSLKEQQLVKETCNKVLLDEVVEGCFRTILTASNRNGNNRKMSAIFQEKNYVGVLKALSGKGTINQ
jgi:hypothetical protein